MLENDQQLASGVRPYFILKIIYLSDSFVILLNTVVPRTIYVDNMPIKSLAAFTKLYYPTLDFQDIILMV